MNGIDPVKVLTDPPAEEGTMLVRHSARMVGQNAEDFLFRSAHHLAMDELEALVNDHLLDQFRYFFVHVRQRNGP